MKKKIKKKEVYIGLAADILNKGHIKILKVAKYKPPTKKSIRNNDNINL